MIIQNKNWNKKAQIGHAMTWLWKILLLVLVLGGVVGIVVAHYSRQVDVRDIEASVISRKLVECIAPNGIYSEELTSEKIKSCLPINEDESYINISVENKNYELGKNYLATLCEALEKKLKVTVYPSCSSSEYIISKQIGDKIVPSKLTIFVAISKIEKNL